MPTQTITPTNGPHGHTERGHGSSSTTLTEKKPENKPGGVVTGPVIQALKAGPLGVLQLLGITKVSSTVPGGVVTGVTPSFGVGSGMPGGVLSGRR